MLIKKCEQHLTVFPSFVIFAWLYKRGISHLCKMSCTSMALVNVNAWSYQNRYDLHLAAELSALPGRICAWSTILTRCYSLRKMREEEVVPQNQSSQENFGTGFAVNANSVHPLKERSPESKRLFFFPVYRTAHLPVCTDWWGSGC